MSSTVANALLAIVGGCGLAVLLLIPVAAYQYRRDGRLGLGDLTVMLGAAIYGLALWCYTMLPLPDEGYACVGRQLTPGATIHEIDPVRGQGWATLFRDPAFLQVALNLVLFLPLGYYVRRVLGRGVVVATLVGLGVSLTIEVTQASGLWFLYPCAYRLFDVDDLIVNTAGAAIGSVLAVLLVRRHPDSRPLPTRITLGRRWMGMACDALFVLLLGSTCAVLYRAWILYGVDGEIDMRLQTALQWGVPGLVEAVLVLAAGRTVGEWVVSMRAVRGRLPAWFGRPAKLLLGVGPLLLLGASHAPWTGPALAAFLLVTLLAPLATPDRRGLSHLASGLDLEITTPHSNAG
ncbi:VanZ family protein [Nocardioides daejeonensis]|uniref:VanZ family protein n=1 Tax=Nocardioides daejeonensis TaxID=1046556 RepID=UPI0013A56532|nr:VanZ family protein [Nocardioides daejeonensis]